MGKVIKGSFLGFAFFFLDSLLMKTGWEVGILGMSLGEKSYLTFGPYVLLTLPSLTWLTRHLDQTLRIRRKVRCTSLLSGCIECHDVLTFSAEELHRSFLEIPRWSCKSHLSSSDRMLIFCSNVELLAINGRTIQSDDSE